MADSPPGSPNQGMAVVCFTLVVLAAATYFGLSYAFRNGRLPIAPGTISTVTPHRGQSTRRIAYHR